MYRRVKAGFVMQGLTFSGWCAEHGINRSNARIALLGAWEGPKAERLRRRICAAAGLNKKEAA